MMESNPHILTSVCAQVDSDFTPVLKTVVRVADLGLFSITSHKAIPNRSKVGSTRIVGRSNADFEIIRILVVGIVKEEVDRGIVTQSVLLGRNQIVVGIIIIIGYVTIRS